jgi:hypothetical protein
MGQYNSTQDFKIEESTNQKNDKYYFHKQSITKIPLKFYRKPIIEDDIFKTYLFL